MGKLPEFEKQAREIDELIKKIGIIVAQNQLILKKLAEKEGIKT
jgi:hypothetical protein